MKLMRMLRRALWAALCLTCFTFAVAAQTQSSPDYSAWSTVAERAELAVENGRASTPALETLRQDIADWREQFLAAQEANAARIQTVESQFAALGTVEEGETEDSEIAQRRAELQDLRTSLRTPVLTAEEAYSRADGIIGEIDLIIRERTTDALLSAGPTPLNPSHWPPAVEDLWSSLTGIVNEIRSAFDGAVQRKVFVAQRVEVILFALLGLIFVLRGRSLGHAAVLWLRRGSARGGAVWQFLASLVQIALPFVGLSLLVTAAVNTNLLGFRGTLVVDWVPSYGLVLLALWWLADRLFPLDGDRAILPMPERGTRGMRWIMLGLGGTWIASHSISVLAQYDLYDDATQAVLAFPLLILAALMLFRMGAFLSAALVPEDNSGSPGMNRARAARLLGRAAQVIAVVSPLLAAVGYGTGASRLMYSSLNSLLLFGLLLVLQHFVRSLYSFLVGTGQSTSTEDEGLIPVLLSFALTLAALPVLALIWGARVADLQELWTRFQEGFSLGNSRISPTDFLAFLVIFTIGYLGTRILQGAMRNTVLPRTQIDSGGRTAIVSGIGYVGIFLAAIIAITTVGIDLSSIAIVAGALSVGIGFGLQNIVSNFVSGIILLIERPVAEGDWIEVGGTMGYVRRISVRSTRIETFDRTDVIVPNADLVSGPVTNWTRGKTIGRVIVSVGVAYGNDTRRIEEILMSIARAHPMVLLNPGPGVVFQGFGADSLDFEIRAILRDVNYMLTVKSDMNHEISKRFAEEGIEIPFAQRDIWIRNPEALSEAAKPGAATETSE